MRIEIDGCIEVRETVILKDGRISIAMPEYKDHVVKIVILNDYGNSQESIEKFNTIDLSIVKKRENAILDGIRYKHGQSKSRETAKKFVKYITGFGIVTERDTSWITLNNNLYVKYSNSVIYDGEEGEYLWYSLSYKDIIERSNNPVVFAFIVRGSEKLVYIPFENIKNDFQKARDIRNNDWVHLNIVFINNSIVFKFKTGKDKEVIKTEFKTDDYYVSWDAFKNVLINWKIKEE